MVIDFVVINNFMWVINLREMIVVINFGEIVNNFDFVKADFMVTNLLYIYN